jgi:hypothetical protein
MKKVIGWLIIISIFLGIFIFMALASNILVAIGCFGVAFLLICLIKLAVYFIFDN